MRKHTKILSMLLAVLMLMSVMLMTAMAAEGVTEGYYTYTVNDEAAIIDVDTSISGDVVIPSTLGGYTVTRICIEAFLDCDNITSITIPGTISEIEFGAFDNCSKLANLIISEGVEIIGDCAFRNCKALKSVDFPDSITSIGGGAFFGCESLSNNLYIPDSVVTLGTGCFADCKSLHTVTIGNGITLIPNQAFQNCENLVNVIVKPDTQVTEIGDIAFGNCSKLNVTPLPYVSTIGERAFEFCSGFERVYINDCIKSIGEDAFIGCDNITDFTVDSDNEYYSSDSAGVLYNKDKTRLIKFPANSSVVTQFTIPDSVEIIDDSAFFNCYKLESLVLPTALKTVGIYAFHNSTSALKHVAFKGNYNYNVPLAEYNHENFNPETDVTVSIIPGTCQQQAVKEIVCSCGYVYYSMPSEYGEHSYTSEVTIPATHIKEGVRTYSCECGDSYTESIEKLPEHNHYATQTIYPTCSTEGYTVYTCACGDSYADDYVDYDYDSHVNEDSDGLCDYCGALVVDCSCNCHSTNGFISFFWKILNFLQKLFGTNPVCSCGMAHY